MVGFLEDGDFFLEGWLVGSWWWGVEKRTYTNKIMGLKVGFKHVMSRDRMRSVYPP